MRMLRQLSEWLSQAKDKTMRRKAESSRLKAKTSLGFRLGDSGTLVMEREGRVVRLYPKEGYGGGTRFSFFGYWGPSHIDLREPRLESYENCAAVLVVAEPRSNWSDYIGAACRVRCMAKIYNLAGTGNELVLRLDFEELRRADNFFHFTIASVGGMSNPEPRWVSLLISSMNLLVVPDLNGFDSAIALTIRDDNSILRQEMMKSLV